MVSRHVYTVKSKVRFLYRRLVRKRNKMIKRKFYYLLELFDGGESIGEYRVRIDERIGLPPFPPIPGLMYDWECSIEVSDAEQWDSIVAEAGRATNARLFAMMEDKVFEKWIIPNLRFIMGYNAGTVYYGEGKDFELVGLRFQYDSSTVKWIRMTVDEMMKTIDEINETIPDDAIPEDLGGDEEQETD
jgi:hypothetical protein